MRWQQHGIIFEQPLPGFSAHAQLPVVDSRDEQVWRIYYSSRDASNQSLPFYVDVAAGKPWHVLACAEAPILSYGGEGSVDPNGVMPTEYIECNGQGYLYYIAWNRAGNKPFSNTIALAIADGKGGWQKQGEVLKGFRGSFYSGTLGIYAQGPDQLHGFYMACTEWLSGKDFTDPCYQIAWSSSSDGLVWQQPAQVAIPFKSVDEGGIVAARVFRYQDCYHMFYAYRQKYAFRSDPAASYRLGYAQSQDLHQWYRLDDYMNDFRDSAGKDAACSLMQTYPYLVMHDESLYLFFNGNGFGQTGIACASLPLQDLPSFGGDSR